MADLREEIKNIAETESVGCLQKRLTEVGVDCDLTQVPAVKVSETFRHALERVLERPIGELSVAEIKALTELTRGVAAPTESTTAHPVLKPVTLPPITIKEFEQDDFQSYVQPIDFVKAYFKEPELFSIRELPARDDGQHFEVYFKGARAFNFFIELPTELQLGEGADLALSLLSGEEEEGLLYGFRSAPYDTNPAVFSTLPFKFNTPVAAAEGRGESFQPPTILRMEENASPESCVERILEPLVRGAPLDEARVRHQLLELGEAGIHRLGEMVISSDPMLRLQGAHGLAIVGAQAALAIDAITAGITRWGRPEIDVLLLRSLGDILTDQGHKMEFEERIRQPGAAAVLGWQLADTLVFQALTGKPDIVAEATRCFDLLDGMKEEWIEKSIARGTLIGAEPGRIAEFLSAVKHYELVAESQFNLPPRFLELSANDEQGGRGALVRLASSDAAMDQKIKQLNRFITSYSPPLCRIAAVNMLSEWAHRDERAAEALVGLLPTFYSTHVRHDDDLSARYSRAVEYSVSRGIVGLGDKGTRLFDRLLAEHPRTATHDHLRYLREKMEEAWNPPVPA